MTALCPDRLASGKRNRQICRWNIDRLLRLRAKVHLDASGILIELDNALKNCPPPKSIQFTIQAGSFVSGWRPQPTAQLFPVTDLELPPSFTSLSWVPRARISGREFGQPNRQN